MTSLEAEVPAPPGVGPGATADDPAAVALRITHVALYVQTLGGQQAILRHHLAHDRRWGLDSHVLTVFEPRAPRSAEPISTLGLTWRHCIAEARQRARSVLAGRSTDVAVYHDVWGLSFFADLDRATRRLAVVHCPNDVVRENLRRNARLLDGVVCLSAATLDVVRGCIPQFPQDRLVWLPVPLAVADGPVQRPPLRGRPFVLGYSGRLVEDLKRVDRLPALYRHLADSGLDVRLEILGDGPARSALERALADAPRVTFHGARSGADYWAALRGWDAIVYVSDVEGLGLSLLEAMSVGALPLYPGIGGGGEPYVRGVRDDLLYPTGDFAHVARTVRALCDAPDGEIERLRARCRELVAPHFGDGYERGFADVVRETVTRPRISPSGFRRRPFYFTDYWPFGVLRRARPETICRNGPGELRG